MHYRLLFQLRLFSEVVTIAKFKQTTSRISTCTELSLKFSELHSVVVIIITLIYLNMSQLVNLIQQIQNLGSVQVQILLTVQGSH